MDVFSYQLVCTDQNIRFPFTKTFKQAFYFGICSGSADVIDRAGKIFESFAEGLIMLQSQHCGWNQHRDLFVVADGFEGGPYGHLRFSESDIAANQPVHWLIQFHVFFDFGRGFELIGGILVNKGGFQSLLQIGIGAVGKTFLLQALRIQLNKVAGNVFYFALAPVFHLFPGPAAQLVYGRLAAIFAPVFGNTMQIVNAYKDGIVVFVNNFDDFLHFPVDFRLEQTAETSHTVIDVHHVIAELELKQFLHAQG